MGKRFGDGERPGRVGAGDAGGPGVDPGPGGAGALVLGQEVADPQAIQHGVAEMGVGEVHHDRRSAVAAPVAGVEVAVHQGVGQSAGVEQLEPAQQAVRRGQLAGSQLPGHRPVEQGADLPGQNGRAPVRQTGRHVVRRDAIGPHAAGSQGGLRGDEAVYAAGDDLG
jgi:hypothetical protein